MTIAELELGLSLLGLGLFIIPRLSLPFRLTMFLLQVIEWWIKTHPTGQKMALETNYDEEFLRLFGVELREYSHLFTGHKPEDMDKALRSHKLLNIGEAAKEIGVHPATLRSWHKTGKLIPLLTKAGHRKYHPTELQKLKLAK